MAYPLTADDARQSLNSHVESKGCDIREKYGPHIGWKELLAILNDRTCVRYPCEVVFDETHLESGEFAHPEPAGAKPEDGFRMYVHPWFLIDLERASWLVLYQLVAVNYGPFASADDAESFGASVLGLSKDEYYEGLCALADEFTAALGPR